jgi:hypothetical protein
LHITLGVSDVAVIPKAFGTLTFGKGTKLWLLAKECLNAFTRHIAYIMFSAVYLHFSFF